MAYGPDMFMAFGVSAALGCLWNLNLPLDRTPPTPVVTGYPSNYVYVDPATGERVAEGEVEGAVKEKVSTMDESRDYYAEKYNKRVHEVSDDDSVDGEDTHIFRPTESELSQFLVIDGERDTTGKLDLWKHLLRECKLEPELRSLQPVVHEAAARQHDVRMAAGPGDEVSIEDAYVLRAERGTWPRLEASDAGAWADGGQQVHAYVAFAGKTLGPGTWAGSAWGQADQLLFCTDMYPYMRVIASRHPDLHAEPVLFRTRPLWTFENDLPDWPAVAAAFKTATRRGVAFDRPFRCVPGDPTEEAPKAGGAQPPEIHVLAMAAPEVRYVMRPDTKFELYARWFKAAVMGFTLLEEAVSVKGAAENNLDMVVHSGAWGAEVNNDIMVSFAIQLRAFCRVFKRDPGGAQRFIEFTYESVGGVNPASQLEAALDLHRDAICQHSDEDFIRWCVDLPPTVMTEVPDATLELIEVKHAELDADTDEAWIRARMPESDDKADDMTCVYRLSAPGATDADTTVSKLGAHAQHKPELKLWPPPVSDAVGGADGAEAGDADAAAQQKRADVMLDKGDEGVEEQPSTAKTRQSLERLTPEENENARSARALLAQDLSEQPSTASGVEEPQPSTATASAKAALERLSQARERLREQQGEKERLTEQVKLENARLAEQTAKLEKARLAKLQNEQNEKARLAGYGPIKGKGEKGKGDDSLRAFGSAFNLTADEGLEGETDTYYVTHGARILETSGSSWTPAEQAMFCSDAFDALTTIKGEFKQLNLSPILIVTKQRCDVVKEYFAYEAWPGLVKAARADPRNVDELFTAKRPASTVGHVVLGEVPDYRSGTSVSMQAVTDAAASLTGDKARPYGNAMYKQWYGTACKGYRLISRYRDRTGLTKGVNIIADLWGDSENDRIASYVIQCKAIEYAGMPDARLVFACQSIPKDCDTYQPEDFDEASGEVRFKSGLGREIVDTVKRGAERQMTNFGKTSFGTLIRGKQIAKQQRQASAPAVVAPPVVTGGRGALNLSGGAARRGSRASSLVLVGMTVNSARLILLLKSDYALIVAEGRGTTRRCLDILLFDMMVGAALLAVARATGMIDIHEARRLVVLQVATFAALCALPMVPALTRRTLTSDDRTTAASTSGKRVIEAFAALLLLAPVLAAGEGC